MVPCLMWGWGCFHYVCESFMLKLGIYTYFAFVYQCRELMRWILRQSLHCTDSSFVIKALKDSTLLKTLADLFGQMGVFFSLHTKCKVKCQRRQKSGLFTFVLGTFLCCAFSYGVWGKSDNTVAVTLQKILKPDTAQWFPGNTVDIWSQQRIQGSNQMTKRY